MLSHAKAWERLLYVRTGNLLRKILALPVGMLSAHLWLVCLLTGFLHFHKNMSTLFPFSLPLGQPSKNMDSLFTVNRENLPSCFSFCFSHWGAQSQNWSLSWALPTSLWQPLRFLALLLALSAFPTPVFPFHPFTEKFYRPGCISVNPLTHFCLE